MTKRNGLIGIIPLLLFCFSAAFAQTPAAPDDEVKALRQEIEAVKAGQTAIQKELAEIKNLLRTRPAGQPVAARDIVLDIGDSPTKGPKDAKVVLVEFSDFQCPFCGRFSRDTIPQVQTDYVDTGKI
jgi:protein-disulfide isomerase